MQNKIKIFFDIKSSLIFIVLCVSNTVLLRVDELKDGEDEDYHDHNQANPNADVSTRWPAVIFLNIFLYFFVDEILMDFIQTFP